MYKVIRNDVGTPVMEQEDNDNVKVTRFLLTGEMEIEFNTNCDPKVKEMYKQLHGERKCKKSRFKI